MISKLSVQQFSELGTKKNMIYLSLIFHHITKNRLHITEIIPLFTLENESIQISVIIGQDENDNFQGHISVPCPVEVEPVRVPAIASQGELV